MSKDYRHMGDKEWGEMLKNLQVPMEEGAWNSFEKKLNETFLPYAEEREWKAKLNSLEAPYSQEAWKSIEKTLLEIDKQLHQIRSAKAVELFIVLISIAVFTLYSPDISVEHDEMILQHTKQDSRYDTPLAIVNKEETSSSFGQVEKAEIVIDSSNKLNRVQLDTQEISSDFARDLHSIATDYYKHQNSSELHMASERIPLDSSSLDLVQKAKKNEASIRREEVLLQMQIFKHDISSFLDSSVEKSLGIADTSATNEIASMEESIPSTSLDFENGQMDLPTVETKKEVYLLSFSGAFGLDRDLIRTPYPNQLSVDHVGRIEQGYQIALNVFFSKKFWEIQSGLVYSIKDYLSIYEGRNDARLVSIPLNLRIKLSQTGKLRGYFLGGIAAHIAARANYRDSDFIEQNSAVFVQNNYIVRTNGTLFSRGAYRNGVLEGESLKGNYMLSANMGVGVNFPINETYSLYIEQLYFHHIAGSLGPAFDKFSTSSTVLGIRVNWAAKSERTKI